MLTIRSFVALFFLTIFAAEAPAALLLTEGRPSPDLGQQDDYALEPNHKLIYHKTSAGWDNGTALGGGGGAWGSITGTLSNQTDLSSALNGKAGPFLSNHTARVEPAPTGNDSTGTIGDLGKPFATNQAVLTAAENAALGSIVILVSQEYDGHSENITTSLRNVTFVGTGQVGNQAFSSFATTATGSVTIGLTNIYTGGVSADTSERLHLLLCNAEMVNISNPSGSVMVSGDTGLNEINDVVAGGMITAYGLNYADGFSAPGFPIYLTNVFPGIDNNSNGGYVTFSINSAGSTVYATHCLIQDVTAAGTLHLIDSRVIGTNNATSTVYEDLLLAPELFDNSGKLSLDGRARKLYGPDGTTVAIDYGTNGVAKFPGKVNLPGTTVASLAGLTPTAGDMVYVTDALAPTYGAVVVGGGSVVTTVLFDGTNWTCH